MAIMDIFPRTRRINKINAYDQFCPLTSNIINTFLLPDLLLLVRCNSVCSNSASLPSSGQCTDS